MGILHFDDISIARPNWKYIEIVLTSNPNVAFSSLENLTFENIYSANSFEFTLKVYHHHHHCHHPNPNPYPNPNPNPTTTILSLFIQYIRIVYQY